MRDQGPVRFEGPCSDIGGLPPAAMSRDWSGIQQLLQAIQLIPQSQMVRLLNRVSVIAASQALVPSASDCAAVSLQSCGMQSKQQ